MNMGIEWEKWVSRSRLVMKEGEIKRLRSCRTDDIAAAGYQSQGHSKDPQTCSTFDQITVWSERAFSLKTSSPLCNKCTHSSRHSLCSSELLNCKASDYINITNMTSPSIPSHSNTKWMGSKEACQWWSAFYQSIGCGSYILQLQYCKSRNRYVSTVSIWMFMYWFLELLLHMDPKQTITSGKSTFRLSFMT